MLSSGAAKESRLPGEITLWSSVYADAFTLEKSPVTLDKVRWDLIYC